MSACLRLIGDVVEGDRGKIEIKYAVLGDLD
jgi:hypothetical protein